MLRKGLCCGEWALIRCLCTQVPLCNPLWKQAKITSIFPVFPWFWWLSFFCITSTFSSLSSQIVPGEGPNHRLVFHFCARGRNKCLLFLSLVITLLDFFKFTLMLSIILRMTLQHLCMHLGRTNFIRNAMVQTVLIIHSTFAFTLETVSVYNLVCHDRREGKATSYSLVVYGNVLKHLDLLLILLWI